jgi:hypothetical protein
MLHRTTALLAASAIAVGLLAAVPASADTASTPTSFPAVRSIAVDDTHEQVFVAGSGNGSFDVPMRDYIEVYDLDGRLQGTIDELPGAYGLVLNAAETKLYVSLYSGKAIAVIDPATLTEIDRIAVETCPESLALSAGVLVMVTDCGDDGQWEDVYALDLGSEVLTRLDSYYGAEIAAANGRAVVADSGLSSTDIGIYDLTDSGIPQLAKRSMNRATSDLAMTPDGQHVLQAEFGEVSQLSAVDLVREHTYEASGRLVSAQTLGATTYVVTAGGTSKSGSVKVFPLGAQTPMTTVPAPARLWILEPMADLSRVYGAAFDELRPDTLSVMYGALGEPSTVIADVYNQPRLDDSIDLRGKLLLSNGEPSVGSEVEVRRATPSGFSILGSTTVGANGWFRYTDEATELGAWKYQFVYIGTGGAASGVGTVDLTVRKKVAPLSLSVSEQRVRAGQSVRVDVSLGGGPTNRSVRLYVDRATRGQRLLGEYSLAPGATKSVRIEVEQNLSVRAVYQGDDEYAARELKRAVEAEVRIEQTMKRWDAKRNGVHYYQTTDEPLLHVKVNPSKGGRCMQYHFQAKRAAGWKWLAFVECFELDRRSTGGVIYNTTGERRTDTLYRVRSFYPGDRKHVATAGEWEYFRFTR